MARDLFEEAGIAPAQAREGRDLFQEFGVADESGKINPHWRETVPDASVGSVAQDILSGALQIGPTALKGIGDIGQLASGGRIGKGLSQSMDEGNRAIRDTIGSNRAAAQARNFQRDMQDDEVGIAETLGRNKGALADQLLPTVGSMFLPVGVAGAAGKVATAGRAVQGMDKAAIAARVAKVQEAAGIGTIAAQNAGDTFSEMLDKGVPVEDAYKAAGITVPFSVVAGVLTKGGAEADIAGNLFNKVAVKHGAGSVLKAGAREGAQEIGEQAGQDLGSAVATGETPSLTAEGKSLAVAGALGGLMGSGVHGAGKAGRAMSGAQEEAGQTPAPQRDVDIDVTYPDAQGNPVTEFVPGGVATSDTEQASQALREPVGLTALDRVGEIDKELAGLQARAAELNAPDGDYGPMFDAERAELAQQQQALAQERDGIAATWPKSEGGAPTVFSTESGDKLDAQYALMDAGDLVTSHDEGLRENPLYPKELQPRDRSRSASELQVSGIVQKLDPARLGVSADAATGAPIVGADGLVESGNARTIAMKRVYQANGQKAQDYRQFLKDNAAQFGLTPEQVDAVNKPVLVRVRQTPVNRAEFARQANASTVQRMSPSEQALSDARRINTLQGLEPNEDGNFSSSRDFIRQFMAMLPITEQSDMIESDGQLSTAGYRRIQNAVLARAYGDSPTLRRMTESMDDNLRNISNALTRVAPTIAAARERMDAGTLNQADIAPDLVQAVEGLSALKDKGWKVSDELGQQDLTGPKYSPEAAELLQFLDANIRSPRRIAEFVQRYYEALEQAGDPTQPSMFGDEPAPSRSELLNRAKGEPSGGTDQNAQRRNAGEGAPSGAQDGRQPEVAPGRRGGAQGDEAALSTASTRQQAVAAVQSASRSSQGAGRSEWVNFPKDSGTIGIPRAEMPQVKGDHRGALLQFLQGKGITYEKVQLQPKDLKPTQAEFSKEKAARWSKVRDGVERSVLVSSDGHVLDGHHQWVAALAANEPVDAIRFNAPIRELLAATFQFPSVQRSEGAEDARAKNRQAFKDALADLADLATKHQRVAMVPENMPGLMPTLVRLMEAGIKEVGYSLKDLTDYVKAQLKADLRTKKFWNKIGNELYRKAAQQAMEQSARAHVDDLFAQAERKKKLDFGDRSVEQLEKEYAKLKDTDGGRVIDVDMVRELSPEYRADRSLAPQIHEAASALAKKLYARALARPVGEGGDGTVRLMAGGGGSGKSMMRASFIQNETSDVVLDGTLSKLSSARANVEAALQAGRGVKIFYVYRSPEKAAQGAVDRAISAGRPVPVNVLGKAHAGAAEVVKKLADEYNDDDRVTFQAIWNDGEKSHLMPVEEIPHVDENQAIRSFAKAVERARSEGRLSDALYEAFTQGARASGSRANDRGLQQGRSEQAQDPVTPAPRGAQKPAPSNGGVSVAIAQRAKRIADNAGLLRITNSTTLTPERKIERLRQEADRMDANARKAKTPDAEKAFKRAAVSLRAAADELAKPKKPSLSRSATSEAVAKWQESLRQASANPQAKDPSMVMPTVLRAMGAKAAKLVLPRRYLQAITNKHPDVPASVFENLPALLADPLFIIPHKDGGLRVFIEAETERGEPIAAGLSVGDDGRIHTVTPLHDHEDMTGKERMARAVATATGRIYARNKEALEQARASAAAAPATIALHRDSVSRRSVVTRADVVKKINAANERGDAAAYSLAGDLSPAADVATMARVQSEIDRIRARWRNAPPIVVIDSLQDAQVPSAVRTYDAQQRSQGATGEPEGFFYKGKVYIVASQVPAARDVARVLMHESLGHYGLRGVFGDKLDSILDQIWQVRRAEVIERARQYGLHGENIDKGSTDAQVWQSMTRDQRRQAAEEVLAFMAQEHPELGFVRRAVAAIRSWLRTHVPGLRMSDDEIIRDYLLPARGWVKRGEQAQRMGTAAPAFQRVWHGTPHRGIEQTGFHLNKIGTGEGAQAYGWGAYFASQRAVADSYRKTLSAARMQIDGASFTPRNYSITEIVGRHASDPSALRGALETYVKDGKENPYAHSEDAQRILEAMERGAFDAGSVGQLYSAEIPENSDLLDWDKPLNEQPSKVRKALAKLDPDMYSEEGDDYDPSERGQMVYQRLPGGPQAASKALLAAGIPGLRYLDGDSRHKPLKDVKREFLAEMPEDADVDEVLQAVQDGQFSPKNAAIVEALAADDWLGFDYPAQAISAALGGQLSNYDASPALVQAVADAQEGGTHNYVIWDEALLTPEAAGIKAMLSRSESTKAAYESRIDALFAGGEASRVGARVLDRSDMLGLLGYADQPVVLAEGKVRAGQVNHQRMTAQTWKKVPEWLENPAAVFASDTVPGRLVFIAPEMVNGSPVRMIVEPNTEVGGLQVHLLINAFDATGRTPWMRWASDGLIKYLDKKKSPGILAPSGLQLSRVEQASRGTGKILTEKNLAGWRKANPVGDAPMLSRAATAGPGASPSQPVAPRSAAQRAEAMIRTKVVKVAPLDAVAHAVTKFTGVEKVTTLAYEKAGKLLDIIVPEKVKAGIIADYGVPEAVIDQRALLQGRQRVQLRKAGKLIDKLSTLTRAESRVAYEWMNMDGSDPKAYLSMMQGLPEESVQVLQDVQKMIDDLSQEAVRLGQLDPRSYERNKFAYLRRSYAQHVLDMTPGEKTKRARVVSILGEQYKGRGMTQAVRMNQVKDVAPGWWGRKLKGGRADTALVGEKFIRLERRAASGQGTAPLPGMQGKAPGKVLEVAWWPASETMPATYKDWTNAGTWEARDTKAGDIIMWRDFTKEEREAMGEVDEARFAIARTLQSMIHDVETGRYLEWIARNQGVAPGATVPGTVVEASERLRDSFTKDEWVQVPETKIPGTQVLKYGKLAGRFIPGPVWNDLRQVVSGQAKPLGETYAKILTLWKTSKTALSPAVHMNNVMSNFVMADFHDVTAGHVAKALRILLAAHERDGKGALGRTANALARAGIADREAAREVLNRYKDSGGDIGTFATAEIAREQIEPLLQSVEQELMQTNGTSLSAQAGVFAALQHLIQRRPGAALEALKSGKVGQKVAQEAANMIGMYQSEDDVFRLAAWLKAKEDGATDIDAGKSARRSFLDYHINAPWVNAMRQTALPFVSFTYRAVPMMLETIGKKPHKLMKLMMVAGAVNALGMMAAGGDDDDEKRLRKLLPEEKAGSIWGMVPKLVRMPWNDKNGSPVYLDVRRFIPIGDFFDLGETHSAIPLLPFAMPGGPLALMSELVSNRSQFTGRDIYQETDTPAQQAAKVADHVYKSFAPNIIGLPGTYATTSVVNAIKGKTDVFGREQSAPYAIASSFGIKLAGYSEDVLKNDLEVKTQIQLSEIDRNIGRLKRQLATHAITRDEFNDKAAVEVEKKRKLATKFREKVG